MNEDWKEEIEGLNEELEENIREEEEEGNTRKSSHFSYIKKKKYFFHFYFRYEIKVSEIFQSSICVQSLPNLYL